ncbi:CHAT domain-containing protein [Kribbella sp. NPDC051770]|uniref:CHAT domain-containing protein n=1 Tax=Kribbella sp. NPDC051770 TaxID=3155413 RepID=UPI00343A9DF8
MTLRFVVKVDQAWKLTTTCPDLPAWEPESAGPDELIRIDDGTGHTIPRPPYELHHRDADHDGLAAASDAAEVMALYDALRERRATRDEQERFGHYLFDVLLGNDRWSEILQTAQAYGHQAIELALALRPDDIDLARLNWEMLCAGGGFVVAGTPTTKVAITRLVETAYAAPPPLGVPPRALFVIGSSWHDETLRPAAELLALLKLGHDGRALRYRVLEHARPQQIRREIEEFQPEIVHFVAHGGIDAETRRGYLLLKPDEHEAAERRYADQILSDLRRAPVPATIVVLSACSTAGAPGSERLFGANDATSMAAELVAGGIPVVVGMAGRVADLASRLFSRTFAESVVHGEPLVRATAEARAAAFATTEDPVAGMDWALPAVFLSSQVPTDYRPLDTTATQERWDELDGWIRGYDDGHLPVFCARENFLPPFRRMFEPGTKKYGLAAYTGSQLKGTGRTRLLRELAAHALRDGHLPLLLTSDRDHPRTASGLGKLFLDEISRVRVNVLGIDEEDTQLLALEADARDRLELNVRMALERAGEVTSLVLNRALQTDLKNLRRDVARQIPYFAGLQSRIVVLMDDIDEYGGLLDDLLDRTNGLFTPYGLGTKALPVPVVLTWAHGRSGDQWVRSLIPNQQEHPWLEVVELAPFSTVNGEDLMAYQTVLLHPFAGAGVAADHVLGKSWVFNPDVGQALFHAVRNNARNTLKGIPFNFHQPAYEIWVELAQQTGFVVPARDEDHLTWLKADR